MTARIVDGTAASARLKAQVAEAVAALTASGLRPGLATVLVGEDPASEVYVRNKRRSAEQAGMTSRSFHLPADASEAELRALLQQLNADPEIHGILLQLPLPAHLDAKAMVAAIAPEKDVDGLTPTSIGLLTSGSPALIPCTPLGCLLLLQEQLDCMRGMDALVVGRSLLVGRPMVQLLGQYDCTVTLAHRYTRNLPELVSRAEILVVAVGQPGLIRGDWIRPGAIVLDVGINRVPTEDGRHRLTGDVDFPEAKERAAAITPVPGGVGPMTIACLLTNTVTAAARAAGREPPVFTLREAR